MSGTASGWAEFRAGLLGNRDAVRALMLARSTQTNEPARCAVLLPVLAALPQPLALIEVGSSGGLCLLPDCYGYDYGSVRIAPAHAAAPVFVCVATGAVDLPTAVPRIAWRAGLDLNPIDLTDPAQTGWLETLVWPGQPERLIRLRAAIAIARSTKPKVVRGDLRHDLARLAAEAPRDATLVILHTAVLSYVAPAADRDAFAAQAKSLCRHWISNEAPGVFPGIAADAPPPKMPGRFLMAVNGVPVAWTDPHGAAMEGISGNPWFAP